MARLNLQFNGINLGSKDLNWGVTRIGRADDNDVLVNHPSVSSHHCEVELRLDTIIIRDCNSTNGTFINNQRIQTAPLEPGQLLRLGEVVATIERSLDKVSIPKFQVEKPRQSVQLGEGIWSCERHNEDRAHWWCPKCQGRFCRECIRELRLMKGLPHKLCPICSAHVQWIHYKDAKGQKKSIWGQVKSFLAGD